MYAYICYQYGTIVPRAPDWRRNLALAQDGGKQARQASDSAGILLYYGWYGIKKHYYSGEYTAFYNAFHMLSHVGVHDDETLSRITLVKT